MISKKSDSRKNNIKYIYLDEAIRYIDRKGRKIYNLGKNY